MSEDICFIVNPASGTGKWKGIEESIKAHLDKGFSPKILFTEYAGHATELAKKYSAKCRIIVAVGGDGIVNEVASGILGGDSILGIIPAGSGNAVAGHLGIPLNHKQAIKCLNKQRVESIDIPMVNDKPFIAIAGTGFDAEIASQFAKDKKRGFYTYIKLSLIEYSGYKPNEYSITIDGKKMVKKAFLISVANGSQYGNKAYIAPEATMKDEWLEVCILKPFPKALGPQLVGRLFLKNINRSRYIKTVKGKEIRIRRTDGLPCGLHYDGEPGGFTDEIRISMKPDKLRVIAGKKGRKI
jgi:YegS/Rv2252/BmrU family lipid kinase